MYSNNLPLLGLQYNTYKISLVFCHATHSAFPSAASSCQPDHHYSSASWSIIRCLCHASVPYLELFLMYLLEFYILFRQGLLSARQAWFSFFFPVPSRIDWKGGPSKTVKPTRSSNILQKSLCTRYFSQAGYLSTQCTTIPLTFKHILKRSTRKQSRHEIPSKWISQDYFFTL